MTAVRVTTVAPYVPHAKIPHAGGQYLFHYLRAIAEHAEVRLIAPATEANKRVSPDAMRGVEVHVYEIPSRSERVVPRALRYVRAAADGLTLGLGERRAFAGDARVRELVLGSDIVELHWSEMLPMVGPIQAWSPTVPVIAFEHDVRYQSLQRRAQDGPTARDRTLSGIAARAVRRREPSYLNRCAAIFTFTAKDVTLLRSLGVHVPVETVAPFLVDPAGPYRPSRHPKALFVAAFDRPENAEGARWLLDEVWPSVSVRCPTARLVLAGANPPPWLAAKASGAVEVTGFVEDLEGLYQEARVVVCPMRSGGGLKFKVPQAMLYGLPVVATSVAAEGILEHAGPDVFMAVTDDAAEMSDALVGALLDPAVAADVGERGREWARHSYRFSASIERVFERYRRLI